MLPVSLTLTASHHDMLMCHLFPDDGCEAVAIALCGRASSDERHKLLVRRIALVPYSTCSVRQPDRVTWPTDFLLPLLEESTKNDWALVKIHGHKGYAQFSSVDDVSDRQLFPSLYSWTDSNKPHASIILMDDGRAFGRVVTEDGLFKSLQSVNVVGDDLAFFTAE